MPVLKAYSALKLDTRCENQIDNETDRRPVRAGDQIASDDYRAKFTHGTHRPVAPSRKYNCHGLTFASRRTWIHKPTEVAKILKEDDYEKIRLEEVLPGDVVVYIQDGDYSHSGIVVEAGSVPKVLSKWGAAHEVIHSVNDCPYHPAYPEYYRIRT